MIIVMGEFRLNPESIEILRNEIAEVIKKSNEENGCISYKFSEALNDPGLIRDSEKWKSMEDVMNKSLINFPSKTLVGFLVGQALG